MMIVKLCKGCIEDLKEYNPYIVPIKVVKVKTIAECSNSFNEDNTKVLKEHLKNNKQEKL